MKKQTPGNFLRLTHSCDTCIEVVRVNAHDISILNYRLFSIVYKLSLFIHTCHSEDVSKRQIFNKTKQNNRNICVRIKFLRYVLVETSILKNLLTFESANGA